MKQVYITNVNIKEIRHLKNIEIPLSETSLKHLILTGKNGSGKTSFLEAISIFLTNCTQHNNIEAYSKYLKNAKENLENYRKYNNEPGILGSEQNIKEYTKTLSNLTSGIFLNFNFPLEYIYNSFKNGEFIVASYKAYRKFEAIIPTHIEKVQLKETYFLYENPRSQFLKYLLDLKSTQAFAVVNGKMDKANDIGAWFNKFEQLLKNIFNDNNLALNFEEDFFKFTMIGTNGNKFDFNTLSSGYGAVLDIVIDLILRMEKKSERKFDFNMGGIVLIDEIETHLHLELQKRILELLTTIFPNIQFIITTHSPFILNSLNNVIIYDLEKNILVTEGLTNIPYEGVVEGYFKADSLSDELKNKFEKYKELILKSNFTDEDFEEISKLEFYLDEIPDYLALGLTTEYQKLKLEFEKRVDIE
ncbi:MAG: AAA family ATPase [Cetobacterium sp.]|uniref:AAA family ATPase n=1 Tax=Cetobacterium sp. TaxID=2071632 RepID=UPI0025BD4CA7|nr:ATP-binding protein [Cetobacterium sp.]